MATNLPIAPPRNWLVDQRASLRDKIAEAKRFNARRHLRSATVAKALGSHSLSIDAARELPLWKRVLRRITT